MPQTFEELISSDLDELYSAALCFTQNAGRAEELLQEAAVRAFHEFRGRSARADFRRWMLEILVASYLRRERLSGTDPLGEELGPVSDLEPIGELEAFPERGTRAYEWLRAWLDEAWPLLDAGDRLVLWLAVVERLRHQRVAEILGLDEEQVKRRHYRARSTLSTGAARQLVRNRARSMEG